MEGDADEQDLPVTGAHVEEASAKDSCSLNVWAELQLRVGRWVARGDMKEEHLGYGWVC